MNSAEFKFNQEQSKVITRDEFINLRENLSLIPKTVKADEELLISVWINSEKVVFATSAISRISNHMVFQKFCN